jgi:glycosyltransferase involved in cell wall biosynthesis
MLDGQPHGRILAAVRVALVDPAGTTPPYDHELARALARRGHDVDLLTSPFPFGPVPAPDGYRRDEVFLPLSGRILRRNPRTRARFVLKGLEYLPSVGRLLRRVGQLEPDVVHVQWLPLPRVDLRWLRRLGRPTVFTAHHALPRDEGAGMEERLRIFEAVERVVVHSHGALERLVALGVPRDRLVHIPHPVFTDGTPEPPAGRTLLFFGLLRAYKGLDVLLRALDLMPGVRLVVAGDPVDPVPRDERVEWRLGFLPDEELAALLREAAAVVLPYLRTDASGVLATALGHGRPAVVSDVGALGETVREFDSGEVVRPGDPDALAAACLRLLEPERLAEAYRGALAARAALTWDASAEAHERLYESVCSRS